MTKQPTGLRDSEGVMIHVGQTVRQKGTCNTDMHGNWALYKIITRGMVPVMSYLYSENGDVLPEGYLACLLSDKYDRKIFLFATDLDNMRPIEDLIIVEQKGNNEHGHQAKAIRRHDGPRT